MDGKELMQKAHALQGDLLGMDIFPWAAICNVTIDTVGAVFVKVTLKGYGDDHIWHLKDEVTFSNYPNEKMTWDEFLDKVSSLIHTT